MAPSGSPLFFFRSRLWSQTSRISGVTQGFLFRRCLPRSSVAVSVTTLLKSVTTESRSMLIIYRCKDYFIFSFCLLLKIQHIQHVMMHCKFISIYLKMDLFLIINVPLRGSEQTLYVKKTKETENRVCAEKHFMTVNVLYVCFSWGLLWLSSLSLRFFVGCAQDSMLAMAIFWEIIVPLAFGLWLVILDVVLGGCVPSWAGCGIQLYRFLGWISRKVLKHGISLVLRYVLCSYLSLFYL